MKPEQAYIELAKAIAKNGTPECAETDPEAFYPNWGEGASIETRVAKQLCSRCPVKDECLNYALIANEPFGIWGGMTTDERKRLKTRRANFTSRQSLSR